MSSAIPVKNRLNRPLKHGDITAIKSALIDYLIDTGVNIDKFKVDVPFLAKIAPFLRNFKSWESIEDADMDTAHPAIRQLFDTLRN